MANRSMPPRTMPSGGGIVVGEGTAVGLENGVAVGPGVAVGVGAGVEVGVAGAAVGAASSLEHWTTTIAVRSNRTTVHILV